jgi:hypothetical protein
MARKEIKIFMDSKEVSNFLKVLTGPGCSPSSVNATTSR